MTIYSFIFYLLALMIIVSTGLAITRRNLVHAVVYLVISFFGSALLFYLMGGPLLAALEVIIYAGAIMILFLFIIMMLKTEGIEEKLFPARQLFPALAMSLMALMVSVFLLINAGPESREPLKMAMAEPSVFGHFMFRRHWLSIEIVSMLLLVALIGVLHLGMERRKKSASDVSSISEDK